MSDRTLANTLGELLVEVSSLANRTRVGTESHPNWRRLSGGLRAVASVLQENGPQSVPRIAQVRQTSRQNIQIAVNRLRKEGLVTLTANPFHKRSQLVELTERGRRELAAAEARDATFAEIMPPGIGEDQITAATALLREVREKLFGAGGGIEKGHREITRPVKRHRVAPEAAEEKEEESEVPVSLL